MRPEAIARGGIPRALALALVVYATALRLYFGAHVELMPEETYYWNYARHLDIGYLDHPPMVAWLIRAGISLFGDTALGVRAGAVCCALIASFFVYRLTRNLFGDASAALALAFAQAMPFFFVQGLLMTPDAPLTAAWAASLHFLERALAGGRARAWWGAGLCLGIGLISKYTIGLLGLAAFLFMLFDRRARPWLRRWEPYAAAALALAIFSPVILWNAQHHWASFAFQTARRLEARPQFALHKLIGASIVLLTPTGFLAAVGALLRRERRGEGVAADDAVAGDAAAEARAGIRWVRVAVLVPLAVFVAFSLRREVKLDWTGAPWLAALPLIAFEITSAARPGTGGWRRGLRSSAAPTILVLCLLYPLGLYHLADGLPGVGYSRRIELLPVGWRELGRQIDALAARYRSEHGAEPLVVGMDRYALASELAFYARARPDPIADTSSGHLFGGSGLMYERWVPAARQCGRSLLLVSFDPHSLDAGAVRAAAAGLGPVERGELDRGGRLVRDYYYRLASGYRAPGGCAPARGALAGDGPARSPSGPR